MENSQLRNIWVVIAAYNESRVIRKVVEEVCRVTANVVVVDDCSHDATSQEALAGGATVLRHVVNRGQGAALQTGMRYALFQHADSIVHFDADGQHRPEDIPCFLDALNGDTDVVLGSRFLGSALNMSRAKKILLKAGILFTWLFSGIKLTDTHNGFRAFSRRAAERISIKENRMAHASEILHDIHQQRLKYREIPVTILYTDYSLSRGQSPWNALCIVKRLVWRKLFLD